MQESNRSQQQSLASEGSRQERGSTSRILHDCQPRVAGAPAAPTVEFSSFYISTGIPSPESYGYARAKNRTVEHLEDALGRLEKAQVSVFGSGMAAVSAALFALGETTSRLLLPSDGYHGVRALAELLRSRSFDYQCVDQNDFEAVERELERAPAVLWAESPTNPMLRIMNLRRLAESCRRHGATFVVDNTTATAYLQDPHECGADVVVTSLSKSSSGHSDLILGATSTRNPQLHERLQTWRTYTGGIAGPQEAWLALRGLKTLPVRIRQASQNAQAAADFLCEHPAVSKVHYPGLEARAASPQKARWIQAQMPRGFGSLLSFELHKGGVEVADRVVAAAQLICPGTSFGGVESSWERRNRWSGEQAPESLIRLSVGIEEIEDLLADLQQALAAATA